MEIQKIAVIGNGQLGSFLYNSFKKELRNVTLYTRSNGYDICEKEKLKQIIQNNNVIINCAAYTNVDKAEIEKSLCRKINCDAVKNVVDLINKKNDETKLIHISTDYVYGNISAKPLTEDMKCKPCNYYGKTKLYADNYILKNMKENFLILRPSWLFGPEVNDKKNFVDKIIDIVKCSNQIKMVSDQVGNLTSTYLVYKVIDQYLNGYIPSDLYNVCCGDYPLLAHPSRFDICEKIVQTLNLKDIKILKCLTSQLKCNAERQLNSVLDCSKIDRYLRISRTSWDVQLIDYLMMKGIKNV